jgi:hypothetical protein
MTDRERGVLALAAGLAGLTAQDGIVVVEPERPDSALAKIDRFGLLYD